VEVNLTQIFNYLLLPSKDIDVYFLEKAALEDNQASCLRIIDLMQTRYLIRNIIGV
jgi:hypothetical protein